MSGVTFVDLKYTIKLAIFFFLFILMWLQISHFDPFSRNSTIRQFSLNEGFNNLGRIKRKLLRPIYHDIAAFSSLVPSNHLPLLCVQCFYHSRCPAGINTTNKFLDQFSYLVWQQIYLPGNLEPVALKNLAAATISCRLTYYLRVVGLNVFYGSAIIFAAHRFIEVVSGNPINIPPFAVAAIPLGFAIVVIFGMFSKWEKGVLCTGAWAKLKEAKDDIINYLTESDSYHSAFIERICKKSHGSTYKYTPCAGGKGCQKRLDHTLTSTSDERIAVFKQLHSEMLWHVIQQLNNLVVQKLTTIIEPLDKRKKRDHEGNVIDFLCAFYTTNFSLAGDIIIERTKNYSQTNLLGVVSHEGRLFLEGSFTKDGYAIIQTDELRRYFNKETQYGSIMMVPIRISDFHWNLLTTKMRRIESSLYHPSRKTYGYLVMASTSSSLFTQTSGVFHMQLISPFVLRSIFELIRDELHQRNHGRK